MKLLNQITKGLGAIVLGLTLVACGSDGGSSVKTLKGTAATGAAIVGTVEVIGTGGNLATATIEVDGSFKVKVNGMDAPFMLRTVASNGSASEYSYAEKANIKVNITPLTTAAMVLASNSTTNPSTMFNSWVSSHVNVTAAGIENAQAIVNANLSAQYIANNLDPLVYDFFGTEFDANHTGFDGLLDSVSVRILNGVITVTAGGVEIPFEYSIDITGFDIGGVSNIGGTTDTGGTIDTSGTVVASGTYTMTVDVVVGGYSSGSVVVDNNIPASAVPTASDFQAVQDSFSSVYGSIGTVTFNNVSVTGNAAQIVAVLDMTVTTQGFTTEYVATYTYTQN